MDRAISFGRPARPKMNIWEHPFVVQVIAKDPSRPAMHRRINESRTHNVYSNSPRR